MYCLFIAFPVLVNSQEIRYNVIIGPSISGISANNNKITGLDSKLAFKAHVQAEYWFNDRYAITAGIGFTLGAGGSMEYLKGGNIWKDVIFSDTFSIYHNLPPNSKLTYRLNFLEFPFGLKLRTKEFGKFRFYVQAPEFSINLLTKARGDVDAGTMTTEDEDIRPMIHFFSLFYGIGIGTEIKISSDVTITGGLRYFQSFTDLTVDSGRYTDGTKEESKGILSSFDIRMGIIF